MNATTKYLIVTSFFILLCWTTELNAQERSNQPNIILIMADDIGYEAFGSYGGTSYPTPRLDKMAADGIQFNHCYSQPLCTPSRVQIMTGKYNFRNYERWGYLNTNETTFAHILKAQGYSTCIAGKWQLRGDEYAPYKAGFDEYHLWQLTFTSYNERYKNPRVLINGKMTKFDQGEYGPQMHTDFIKDFMERNQDGPFLVYFPMALTHRPYVPSPDSKDYDTFAIPSSGNAHDTKSDPKYFKDEVAYLDRLVGEIIDKTHELGIAENTLILFTGDNGTGKGITSKMGKEKIPGMKGATNQYGTHVPLIGYWAGKIKGGQVSEALIDFTDFLPTMAETAGIPLPETFIADGTSFLGQMTGEVPQSREWVFCHFDPKKSKFEKRRFVHNREWKLYENGEFYDMKADPYEKKPIPEARFSPAMLQTREQFRGVLGQMKVEE